MSTIFIWIDYIRKGNWVKFNAIKTNTYQIEQQHKMACFSLYLYLCVCECVRLFVRVVFSRSNYLYKSMISHLRRTKYILRGLFVYILCRQLSFKSKSFKTFTNLCDLFFSPFSNVTHFLICKGVCNIYMKEDIVFLEYGKIRTSASKCCGIVMFYLSF